MEKTSFTCYYRGWACQVPGGHGKSIPCHHKKIHEYQANQFVAKIDLKRYLDEWDSRKMVDRWLPSSSRTLSENRLESHSMRLTASTEKIWIFCQYPKCRV
jgi:hypothetical protein